MPVLALPKSYVEAFEFFTAPGKKDLNNFGSLGKKKLELKTDLKKQTSISKEDAATA